MANNSIALNVEVPDFGNSFSRGAAQAQERQFNSLRMDATRQDMAHQQAEQGREEALQLMSTLGAIGLGAMNGDINGEADPQRWEEGLDFLDQSGMGLDTKRYRGKPQLARMLVDASISATDRIRMAKDDRAFQLSLQQFNHQLETAADSAEMRREGLDIQRKRLDLAEQAADRKANAPPKLTSAELKAVHAAEDELPALDNSIMQLERALELNDKAYSGFTAGARGALGSKLPDDWMLDDIADPDSAKATSEYQAIMTGEAAQAMSAALKGATTDRELAIFIDIIGDVSKPPEVRKNAINRLLTLAHARKQTATKRIGELRNVAPVNPAPAESGGVEVGTEDGGYRFLGGDPSDEANWELVP